MQAAVFLDRDDTLIHNSGDLGDPNEVRLIQGAAVAIGSLRGLGYRIVVVTNQGGVARGKYTEADVDAVHARINELVQATASGASIDRFYYCPYHPEGTVERYRREHPWRKPQPGMLLQAAQDMRLDLSQCWMIGDQMRDVEAGAAAGTRTILLSKDGRVPDGAAVQPHFVARSLVEAVRIVAQQRKPEVADEIRQDEPGWRRSITGTPRREPASPATTSESAPSQPSLPTEPAAPEPSATPAATTSSKLKQIRSTRPFIPWTIQPVEAPPAEQDVDASPRPATTTAPAAPSRRPVETEPASRRVEPIVPGVDETKESAAHDSELPSTTTVHATLRQILQELRNQRGNVQEFTALGYLAIVLQVVAAVCLIAAFMMGPHEEGGFNQWLGCAIFVQLTVISVLLFDR